jgi:hypothetical protein
MNEWNAGETKEIELLGTAVHGGGSCQFSITTDTAPTKDTQWKVIHSIEGGCPAAVEGNLVEGSGENPPKFPVTMPKDVPSGTYTFAWTWNNKIGNREFYMNCAPIQVGGGGDTASADVLGKLPDMFVANMPPEQCLIAEGFDLEYPNPGDSVVKGTLAKLGSASGAGCAGSPSQATNAPASSGSGGAATSVVASSAPAATTLASTTPAATVPAASNTGGIFAPGASSAAGTAPSSTVVAPAPTATDGGNSTPPSGDCTACSTDGAVVCIGSNQFALCNQGCAVAQDLAAGTTCANGVISRRSVRRFPRAALHRRHGSAHI